MQSKDCVLLDWGVIKPDPRYACLDKQKRNKLIDNMAGKGLIVDLPITHTGRVINGRVYTVWGQMTGARTALTPFPKPVIRDHNRKSLSTIGRFVDARWVSNNTQNLLPSHRFAEVATVLDSEDAEAIYNALSKNHLLNNKNWEGVGHIDAKLRITDPLAIERFLDGRDLTFSCGGITDRMICSVCYNNWFEDVCEHRPYQMYDGVMCVHITGSYSITEVSTTPDPADDLSFVRSMRLEDTASSDFKLALESFDGHKRFYVSDSAYTIPPKERVMLTFDIKDLYNGTLDLGTLLDDLNGETHIEMVHLVRLHDGLHGVYDWQIKYGSKEEIPKDVFKLHNKLHMISMEMGFRDSMVNGLLDEELTEDKQTEGSMMDGAHGNDEEEGQEEEGQEEVQGQFVLTDEFLLAFANRLRATGYLSDQMDSAIWDELDTALGEEVHEDARLSEKEREALDDSVFLGPDRKFPIGDKSHFMAAMRLTYQNCSVDQQKALHDRLLCIGRERGWVTDAEAVSLRLPATSESIKSLMDRIEALEARLSEETAAETEAVPEVEEVENPNQVATEDELPEDVDTSLTAFERKVLDTYNEKRRFFGASVADSYLATAKSLGWVASDFDPNKG